jgi:hypothetical protein
MVSRLEPHAIGAWLTVVAFPSLMLPSGDETHIVSLMLLFSLISSSDDETGVKPFIKLGFDLLCISTATLHGISLTSA